MQDTAEYTCVADNGLDTDEHTAAVVIKGKAGSASWLTAPLSRWFDHKPSVDSGNLCAN